MLCLALAAPAFPARAADIEAAFSPYGKSLELVLSVIKGAKKSIRVAAFRFTSKPVSRALRDACKRGVDVKVVADHQSNAEQYSSVTFLANQDVPVRLNARYANHHHKFMVVDGRHVQTGSFNYSGAAADKNAENVLVVRDHPALAAQYAKEWQRLWDEGEPVGKKY
jgi:phosphatidylserine/phosphatidylglycerophosphate/cardiolipin synthase-like enzyme